MMLPADVAPGLPFARGRLYRAGVLTMHGQALIGPARALGIRHVLDLRSMQERDRELSLWGALMGVVSVRAPVDTDVRAPDAAIEALIGRFRCAPDAPSAHALMRTLYRGFADAFLPHLPALFTPLARGEPLLVHCTAGKDRTGFACALVARAMGVPAAQVVLDYLRHGQGAAQGAGGVRLRAGLARHLGVPADDAALAVLSGVDAAYLCDAFAALDTRYGSVDAYLAAGGVGSDTLAACRGSLAP
ncbi:tyrosine-protein phosphatase [Craterilacuibacter sp. RT1T]|uniref:tyrosine-protein phosphatase n=1 Tax=Craterilacuibacter sp. RT1T TaxID=2942211 RepID=UPI0020BFDA35|nr:tyrosine-protein phosphatase [Craterilacuibacter sp. RT1T]MCL6262691.1 tyrosine-protein phosphatase [Craterilacuibacter sp. RT1T]